ncbi:MAG: hypothetical protein WC526_01945 [Patescibacteria group bacterium]
MDPILHLHEFFVEGGDAENSHVLLNITEPATPAEKDKGYFFAVCEINNGEHKSIEKLQHIIDEVENDYYETPDQADKSSLEIVLDKINKESFSLVKPDLLMNCLVGAIREQEIIFSFYGEPQMLLFYKTKDGNYKVMDLITENRSEEPEASRQLFSQIIQGKIGQNDYFFASTPHVKEYFSNDRLQKIVTTRPPRQSSEHLQRVLAELKSNTSFGGIIIHFQKGDDRLIKSVRSQQAKGSVKSLSNLFNTEQKTANILSSSFLPRLQNRLNNSFKGNDEDHAESATNMNADAQINSTHLKSHRSLKEKTNTIDFQQALKQVLEVAWQIIKYIARGLAWLAMFIAALVVGLGRTIVLLFIVIFNYKNRRQDILNIWSKRRQEFINNLKRLPLITKILLIASVLVCITFVFSLIYLRINQQKAATAKAYADAVSSINTKIGNADSASIYGDNSAAMTNIKEAQATLAGLPCKTADEKNTCQSLGDQLNALLLKLRKVTVAAPELLADWANLAGQAGIENIVVISNQIIGFGSATSNLFVYDPVSKSSKTITSGLAINGFTAGTVPKENDYALLLADNKLAQYNPTDNSVKFIDVSYPNTNVDIKNIMIYNRRLYSLDTANNQIYRHDSIKTGFGRGTNWIKDAGVNLAAGIDLATDGDMFVLESNGTIDKFTSGQKQPYTVSGLDPALDHADEIYTYTDLTYNYILDSQNKRIIILDKTGQLIKQITANEFVKPTGMIVDEAKNVIYVVDSEKLYKITLN